MFVPVCVFDLKGEGEPAGQNQREPTATDARGRYDAGAFQETGEAQL